MHRHKTEGPKQKQFEDEGFQLKGWNYDTDDISSSKNLLRVLEKKITFPALQNMKNSKQKTHKKLQTLPAILETVPTEHLIDQKISKIESAKISQIIKQAKEKLLISNNQHNKLQIDTKHYSLEKNKPLSIECRKNIAQQTFKDQKNTKNISKLNTLIHKSHTTLFKWAQGNESIVNNPRTIQQIILKTKHNKISSVVNLPTKTKLRIFNEYGSHQKLQQQQNNKQKNIKWDKFSKSQQKITKKSKIQKQQKEKIAKIHKLLQESSTKINWFQKLFQAKKHKTQTRIKNKVPKVYGNDFMDDHLQSTDL